METIIIKNQKEWDALPEKFKKSTAIHIYVDPKQSISLKRSLQNAYVSICGGTVSAIRGGTVSEIWGGTVSEICGGTVSAIWGGTVSAICGGTVSEIWGGTVSAIWGGTVSAIWGGTVSAIWGNKCGPKIFGHSASMVIGPIGSRGDKLSVYSIHDGIFITTGCFQGSLKQFSDAVRKTHGDNIHGIAYKAVINMLNTILKHSKTVNK